jgi:hypothetical protein
MNCQTLVTNPVYATDTTYVDRDRGPRSSGPGKGALERGRSAKDSTMVYSSRRFWQGFDNILR